VVGEEGGRCKSGELMEYGKKKRKKTKKKTKPKKKKKKKIFIKKQKI
jgi:hypothetical protein